MTSKISTLLVLLLAATSSLAFADTRDTNTSSAASASPSASDASSAQPRLRYRIVVDQGKWDEIRSQEWSTAPDVGDGIQAQLIDKLQKSGYFVVLEREQTAVAQAGNEDAVDATKRQSIPDGATAITTRQQRTAANYIITPTVFSFTETGGGGTSGSVGSVLGGMFGGIHGGSKKTEDTLVLNIRISDAQTGEVLDTQTAKGKAESKESSVGLSTIGPASGGGIDNDQFKKSPAGQAVDEALDDAVKQIVTRLSAEPWTAMVAAQDQNTKRVIINAGDRAGVTVGQEFDVFQAGAPVLDPDSGQVISTGDDVKIGRIRVQRVQHDASYCDVVDGTTFETRDIIKPAQ